MTIWAIILAAGKSRRMGTQKLLLPFAGRTVIAHIVDQVLRSRIDQTIVIVAPEHAAAVAAALAEVSPTGSPGANRPTLVTNPDPDGDMLSSVRCGLRALPADCAAVLVALGDQPAITSDLINAILDAFESAARPPGRDIVVPVHAGRRGHPILFSMRYRPELLAGYDQVGLRGLPERHADAVLELPVADESVLADMDYPEDYRRELETFRTSNP